MEYSNVAALVDIAAPGTNIVSAVFGGAYQAFSGTSMAAPHVAGAVALLREQNPNMTSLELEALLESSGEYVSDPRTGTKVTKLLLSAPATVQSAAAPVVAETQAGPDSSSDPVGAASVNPTDVIPSGRFIVRTFEPEAALRSAIEQKCPDLNCTIEPSGSEHFVIEVTPKVDAVPWARDNMTINKQGIEEMLGRGKVEVFDEKLFSPMTQFR